VSSVPDPTDYQRYCDWAAPLATRMVFHSWMARAQSTDTRILLCDRDLQRTLQQHLSVVRGNHLHRCNLIDGR
jgi:hypothetical protein